MNQSTNISHEPGAAFETLLGMLLQLSIVRDLSLLGELQSKKGQLLMSANENGIYEMVEKERGLHFILPVGPRFYIICLPHSQRAARVD